jgi:hypothetical protein
MKPSQAFGVVVRVVGLLGWVAAFFYLMSAIVVLLAPSYRPVPAYAWWHYLLTSVVCFLAGWFLLRRADRVVAFAYRINNSDASDV